MSVTTKPPTVKIDLAEVVNYAQKTGAALPRRPSPAPSHNPPLPTPAISTQKVAEIARRPALGSIVLIERDAEVYRNVAAMLQHEGYTVFRAGFVGEARGVIANAKADYLVARRDSLPVSAETELFLREISGSTHVRIVNNFSELVLNPRAGADTMTQAYLTMLDFLVSQLEGTDPQVRGHSGTVAKYCSLVGKRMGMSPRDLDALHVAALLHDLDNLIAHHMFSKVTQDAKGVQLPSYEHTADQLSQMSIPFNVSKILVAASRPSHAPDVNGMTPPLASRILRIADVYDTLRRTNQDVEEEDAFFSWMRHQAAGTFDAHALEIFVHLRKSERMLSKMDMISAKVLIVNPNPEEVSQLQLRLENDDCRVLVVNSVDAALKAVATESITLLLTEFSFGNNEDGLRLLRTLKVEPAHQNIPVFFLSSGHVEHMKQALELGAEDWFPKPYNADIISLKLDRFIKRLRNEPGAAAEGVRGSLRDLGLIEMVQILGAANRSVRIALDRDGVTAELVVHCGKIISATQGELTGNHAAIEILLWEEGNFHILPLKTPPATTVTMNTDNLVMESCLQKDSRAANANGNGNGKTSH